MKSCLVKIPTIGFLCKFLKETNLENDNILDVIVKGRVYADLTPTL